MPAAETKPAKSNKNSAQTRLAFFFILTSDGSLFSVVLVSAIKPLQQVGAVYISFYNTILEEELHTRKIGDVSWGMREITGFQRRGRPAAEGNVQWANELNRFFKRFDPGPSTSSSPPTAPLSCHPQPPTCPCGSSYPDSPDSKHSFLCCGVLWCRHQGKRHHKTDSLKGPSLWLVWSCWSSLEELAEDRVHSKLQKVMDNANNPSSIKHGTNSRAIYIYIYSVHTCVVHCI